MAGAFPENLLKTLIRCIWSKLIGYAIKIKEPEQYASVFLFRLFEQGTTNYGEVGLPYIQNYLPEDYGNAYPQTWGVVQDSLGILYFANGTGVLMYDGIIGKRSNCPRKAP